MWKANTQHVVSRSRGSQPCAAFGVGSHFVSPQKRPSKRKTRQISVPFFDLEAKRRRLTKEFNQLLATTKLGPSTSTSSSPPSSSHDVDMNGDDQWVDEIQDAPAPTQPPDNPTSVQMPTKKRLTPDQATIALYTKWQALLPHLVEPLLAFTAESIGKVAQVVGSTVGGSCKSKGLFCDTKEASILCLYFDRRYRSYRCNSLY